ncbi:nucleoside 2-deoxyribosyltransferase [Bordetella flabilis]|uniref:Nucleoside 2-deoxyribosyltransferase n=1 Tax=Bordetella flabilis TaxID=463014 RepID=A0A193G7X4_9BORD|nr:nucleoside 2-deoxyribosyltransferase [Bordetella flabilis]ANN75763.1 nucleoside 2-deoxyribosyltransferase [Bordetella flabilis]
MTASGRAYTLYLAGFDVFRPDAVAYGESLKAMCRQHGIEGLYPLDNAGPAELRDRALAAWIYRSNIALIQRADGVLANLNPFRGAEPDSGTAFEVGYAVALGKPVWAYTRQAGSIVDQVAVAKSADGTRHVDAGGYTVEDFGMNLNLMLACSATVVVGDAAACLARVARDIGGGRQ